jgi:Zn-dependent protease with chaperone function
MLNPNSRDWILLACLALITGAPFYFKNWLDRTRPLFAETVQKKTTHLSILIFAALFTGGFLYRQENSKIAGALLFAAILSFSFLYQFAGRYQRDAGRLGQASRIPNPIQNHAANLRLSGARLVFGALLVLVFSKFHLFILLAPVLIPFVTPLFLRLQHSCSPMSDSELRSSIMNAFARESVPLANIYLIDQDENGTDSGQKNAFLAGTGLGFGPFGRTLFITLPLIRALEEKELRAVVLHEAAHAVQNHSIKRIVASVGLMVMATFWITLPVAFLMPTRLLAISLSVIATVFVQALLLSRFIARQEHEADLLAVQMGASSNALISALRKLSEGGDGAQNTLMRVLSGNLYPTVQARIACIGECEVPGRARVFPSPAHSLAYSLLVLGVVFWSAGARHEQAKFSYSERPMAGR